MSGCAGSSSEVIEAETALSQRQQELESLQLQRRSLTDQVALSTLSVSFEQESKPGSVAPGGFRGGLIAGRSAHTGTDRSTTTGPDASWSQGRWERRGGASGTRIERAGPSVP